MKKILFKILKVLSVLILALLVSAAIWVFFTGPELPENTDKIIEEVMEAELPELLKGKTGYIVSDGHKIWYESITPKDSVKGTIMLFMGISNDALGWPPRFLEVLVDSSYQVIRYDYRSTGLSDWIDDYERKPFSLANLAKDAVVILDSLHIEKAHLVGVSLGGMVAQDFSIHYPGRSLSLSSIMSSGNIMDPELPGISMTTIFKLMKVGIKYSLIESEENTVKLNLAARIILRGNTSYSIGVKEISQQVLYNLRKRNGYNFNSSEQHQQATFLSGSRYDKLKISKVPLLIIHGEKDPLIPIEHSKKLDSLLPNARSKWFRNLGHDIPNEYVDSLSIELFNHFNAKY